MEVDKEQAAGASRSRSQRVLTRLLIVLTVSLTLDLCASVFLRALGRHPADTPDKAYRTRHAAYHHSLEPGVSSDEARWGPLVYPLRTNSLGFRDAEVRDVALATERERIVVIGDSFTEGLGVAFSETFVGRLAQALEPRGIEVLNAGVLSYAPSIYLAKTRHLLDEVGLEFDHLVVMLDLSDIQDEVDRYANLDAEVAARKADGARRPRLLARCVRFIDEHTVLLGSLRNWMRGKPRRPADAAQHMITGALDRSRCLWTVEPKWFEAYGREGLERATQRMDRLARLLDERGIELTVAVYPWPDQIQRRDLESRHVAHWRAWAEQHGAGFVNHFPDFIDDRPADEVIDEYFIPGDVHHNSTGHARLAERLLSSLP